MMNKHNAESCHARWARLRFTVIGTLLASPPPKGQLKDALAELAKKPWLHPTTSLPVTFGLSTIERWYYRAKEEMDPVAILRHKKREDAGQQRVFGLLLQQALRAQYQSHKSWSYQLHADNLKALSQQQPELGKTPSYSTVRRYMKAQGLVKQRRILQRSTAGTLAAEQRLEAREVRSYEVDHIHGLWHLDFHHCSRTILLEDGRWVKPLLLGIMDDRSRLICHAQWYLHETAECLVHGFAQAVQKRALPRELLTDNGAAMVSAEFTQGLERLGSLHLRQVFRQQVKRKQRRSDGTISLDAQRFEIPSLYRHLENIYVQYARWDMTQVHMVDSHDNTLLCRIYPLDKSANASGKRRVLNPNNEHSDTLAGPAGIAPLLKQLIVEHAATGYPPAYIPKHELKPDHQEENP